MFDLKKITRPNILELKPYSSARDEFNEVKSDMVFIDANENPFDNGLNRYPDPQQINVKQLIAQNENIAPENILLGNGSDEVLDLIFRAFCEPNQDKIITLPPTYGMYKVLSEINAVENLEIVLNNEFQPAVERILESQNVNAKILFLCSPNNPTANSFDALLIDKLLKKFNGIVVIDEAYIDFSKQQSWVNRLVEYPNLIVTKTLSKAYGLAGIRLGICFASKEIISILNNIKPPYNVNTLTQQKAIEQLYNKAKIEKEVEEILKERNRLKKELKTIDVIEKVYPSDSNFLLVKVDDAEKRYKQLLKQKIVVRNRSNQILCKNCLRLTIGLQEENNKLINALKKLI